MDNDEFTKLILLLKYWLALMLVCRFVPCLHGLSTTAILFRATHPNIMHFSLLSSLYVSDCCWLIEQLCVCPLSVHAMNCESLHICAVLVIVHCAQMLYISMSFGRVQPCLCYRPAYRFIIWQLTCVMSLDCSIFHFSCSVFPVLFLCPLFSPLHALTPSFNLSLSFSLCLYFPRVVCRHWSLWLELDNNSRQRWLAPFPFGNKQTVCEPLFNYDSFSFNLTCTVDGSCLYRDYSRL